MMRDQSIADAVLSAAIRRVCRAKLLHVTLSVLFSGHLLASHVGAQRTGPKPSADSQSAVESEEAESWDVVVYGGTSAGVMAAIQVRRMGHTVLLIEPTRHLGGLTTSGLGRTDTGDKSVIGGLARQFYRRVKQHYDDASAWKWERPEDYDSYRPDDDGMWNFEPRVAEAIIERMVAEAQVDVVRGERLERRQPGAGAMVQNGRIQSIRMESGAIYRGRMFLDATYEGDLMAAANVTYTVGREPNSMYGESLNGIQPALNTHSHRFLVQVDPYIKPGQPDSGLLPGIRPDGPGPEGDGDRGVQAYCYRMCMSNAPENRVPFPKPEGYDELEYELLLRNFEAGDLRVPLHPAMMPNRKTDTNNNGAVSTDYIGMNYAYPEASYEERDRILERHTRYQQGLMWTLANHPRVPEPVRREMQQWGLAKDEFVDNGHWPYQIYVREARRMVSDYVVTELDCRALRVAEDPVGMGSYNMDSHNIQRYVTEDGHVQNEGDVQETPGGPYAISYRSLVPRRGEVENLLVPVCLSSSHIAYGSIRMEPVFMVLGQSAATAACQALEQNVAVQDLQYAALRARLLQDGQVLHRARAPRPFVPPLRPDTIEGLVVDDGQAERKGFEHTSTSVAPYVGTSYRHDGNEQKGNQSIRFAIRVPQDAQYAVRIYYTPHGNRASNVPVTVRHASGASKIVVDQRTLPDPSRAYRELGVFRFERALPGWIEIANHETDGYVVADAVQLLRQE